MAAPKIIVVGGGLAGLSAVIKIAEMGGEVDLFSIVPVKRCAPKAESMRPRT
jgi:succinate dehydrogenase / fumarate reductase flavoprotein subunit